MESIVRLSRKRKGVKFSKNTFSNLNQEATNMISCFNNFKSPKVIGEIDITDFIESIKTPDQSTRRAIEDAREHKVKGEEEAYNYIKQSLPCFTLNFSFNFKKENVNIKDPTGFIYIDVDGNLDINVENKLIFASWKSLSGLGLGILVRVQNLTLANFKSTYYDIAKCLSIDADKGAAKATQFNVHSYDKDIYLNTYSTTWYAKDEVKKTPNTLTLNKKKEKDVGVVGVNRELVYNNIGDYEFGDKEYLFFPDEKEPFAEAFIPSTIPEGSRNQILSSFANQMRAFNPIYPKDKFINFILNVNRSRCTVPLKDEEVSNMVNKILEKENIEPIYNRSRRVLFNPKSTLTKNEKMDITNKLLGSLKIARTKFKIQDCLDSWDVEIQGKVTAQKLAKMAVRHINTIEKYYKEFKYQRTSINNQLQTS